MRKVLRKLILICFICQGCTFWKSNLATHGDDAVVKNAVLDFCNTSPLSRQDKTFEVFIRKSNYIQVSIIGTINKLIVTKDDGKSSRMPTRYIEYDNKLFYWYSENYSIDDSVFQKLNQFGLIDTVESFALTDLVNDDAKKGMDYFFCEKDFREYKKYRTNGISSKYKYPKLKCE